MRLLLTRPEEDAARFAEKSRALGHDVLVAPMLRVEFFEGANVALEGIDAILATSANGVRALARRTSRRDVALYAVGPQTAETARAAGFVHVKTAGGDAKRLAEAVCGWLPAGSRLFHAAGAEAGGKLADDLKAKGYRVTRETLYAVRAADKLPDAASAALARRALDAVVQFSPRSAAVFAACVEKEGLAGACAHLIAICISQATAEKLARLPFKSVRVAERPDETALLAALDAK